jgi:hypothetical protein
MPCPRGFHIIGPAIEGAYLTPRLQDQEYVRWALPTNSLEKSCLIELYCASMAGCFHNYY